MRLNSMENFYNFQNKKYKQICRTLIYSNILSLVIQVSIQTN